MCLRGDSDRLDALIQSVGAYNVCGAVFDIRDEAARDAALDALPEGFREIDLLVNNAGLALGTLTSIPTLPRFTGGRSSASPKR